MDLFLSTKDTNSIKEPNSSIYYWKKFRIAGPGALVAVGYIDPGNWATEIAGGSSTGYALLSIVLISSIMAILLQVMSARLGIATGKNLAELSREAWPHLVWPSWILAELAIVFTDLAEVLGAAIALQLLFSIPLIIGVILTVLDVFLLLLLQRWGMNLLTRIILSLLFIISCGFVYELALAQPAIVEILQGFIPKGNLILNPQLLFLSLGVIGATVMPHNLYLHSYLVASHGNPNKRQAQADAFSNTVYSLLGAMLLNCALVVLAASVFHHNGHTEVANLNEAHFLISSLLGTSSAGIVLGIMLLASGQSATITGTLAGQVVMEGFIKFRMKLWVRRFITRGMALIPALFVIVYLGDKGVPYLLISSQVFLSIQLPFAMISLLLLTSDKERMGALVNNTCTKSIGWICALLIILANCLLFFSLII